jgi:pimeloyl-ACP methyl ester carboxylesterase
MSTNGPHPQRFADLIATDPAQQAASAYMAYFRTEGFEDYMAADDYGAVAAWFDGVLSAAELTVYKAAWSQEGALTGGLNWYRANDLEPETSEALMAGLDPVAVPVSVLWGADDDAVLVSNAEGLEPFAPDLEVQIFEGVDHWIEHRVPEAIADALRALDARATP